MLDSILASVRARLDDVIARGDVLRAEAAARPKARDFAGALSAAGLSIIAEVKRRSPSAGQIAAALDPVAQAAAYGRGGAAAVSVLTEADHFGGSADDLAAARAAVSVPVLRKDFILDPAQVWESRAMGADALLLIVAILDDRTLASLIAEADATGIAALVEVHTPDEARRATAAGASIVGVNNRDLATFSVDLATCEQIRPLLPDSVTVAESGMRTAEDTARMAASGFDAVLVGEVLVRASDPAGLIISLRGAA